MDRHVKRRQLTTFLVALSFLTMLASGLVLFIAPSGRISRDTGWAVLALDRAAWEGVHSAFSVLFLIAVVLHAAFNWRALRRYVTDRATHHLRLTPELALAVALVVLLLVAAVQAWPPVSYIADLHAYFRRDFWR